MAQYDQQYTGSVVDQERPRAPRKLAADLLLDLLIIAIVVVVAAFGMVAAIVAVRAVQLGLEPAEIARLSRGEQLQLIGSVGMFLVLVVQNWLFVAVPVIRTRLLRREPLATIGLRAPEPLRLILFGLGLGLLVLIANAILGLTFSSLGIRQNQSEQYPLFAGDYAGQALFMLGAAVLVPIGEEVLFRGYVFSVLRRIGQGRRWGLPAAYLLSALLFGVAHSLAATEGVIALIVPTVVMGLALAWGVQRTGSLLPSIIAHGVNNGVALLALVTCINNPGICPGV